MLRTVAIVPTITTNNKAAYRAELEKINTYTKRVQVDVADGTFNAETTLDVSNAWWPKGWTVDLHMIVRNPSQYLETILKLQPAMCILQAEAAEDLVPIFAKLKERGIKTGVALLPTTFPGYAKRYIDVVDHVLIFAGQLGTQGGMADLMQVEKVPIIREIKAEVEIGWDGGANLSNIRALSHAGVDVINVGAALSTVPDPAEAYAAMVAETDKTGVVL